MFNKNENISSVETKERGVNVEILLKIIRHGERNPKTNFLTDQGREITRQEADKFKKSLDDSVGDYSLVKAIGSTVGPLNDDGMGRAEETAHIYAKEVSGENVGQTRKTEVLSYENIKSPVPYNHRMVYNSFIPENFDNLGPDEKLVVTRKAQEGVTAHLMNLNTPEAIIYRKELAGSIAYLINHYQEVIKHLKSGEKFLIPAGCHGPTLEFLLQEALIRKNEQGETIRGFKDLSEIGGQQNTSEAFSVEVETDELGNNKPLKISFDNSERPEFSEMFLDSQTINELASFYEQLHPEIHGLRERKEK